MKKILIILSGLVVALTFGSAYAGRNDMSAGAYNGITASETTPVASDDIGSGLTLENGITAFDIIPAEFWTESEAAGGLATAEPSMELRNEITVFDTSAVPQPN